MGTKKVRKFSLLTSHFSLLTSHRGFTLLELVIVLFLITLILGLSAVFFANTLPSARLNATAREMSATVRLARSLARIHGATQTMTIDLDAKDYGIEGRPSKTIPPDLTIKIIDPFTEEVTNGKYRFVFRSIGGAEGGTIVLSNSKRSVSIQMDPIIGVVVIK